MYFVRSGYIFISEGMLYHAGHMGYSWSSTAAASSTTSSATLYIEIQNILASAMPNRYAGMPLRPPNCSQIYFVRSGYIFFPTASIRAAGDTNHSQASTADVNTTYATNFNLGALNAYSSNSSPRSLGFPLCILYLSLVFRP